ncbi:MAG TPA: ATP-binding protein [Euryarchaeota archaeon]|nr:AAA-like domain protein [archaeon BMS3Abin16]GBE56036.1 AAA-like domain protein [archaeon BMS3Bbin16]HDH28388.1 ATP-binding protein [Euryarchaeota archaeon]HDY74213.1 ATP-binding protein [Euryarchaeota archaeon]
MAGDVGLIFGEVGHRDFNFLLNDNSEVSKGDYVKVNHETYDWVLCQITSIKISNEFYSLSAMKSEREVKDTERRIATAKIIGFVDEKGILRAPKIPFKPGQKVYAADSKLIKTSLGLKGKGNGIYLGLLEGHRGTPVYLNPNKLFQKHVSVLAKTGAGKSYTVGVLIEELLEKKIPTLIIDPHGEYASLKQTNINTRELEQMERFKIQPKGYDNITEFTPYLDINPDADRKFVLDFTKLSPRDLIEALPTKIPASQKAILFECIKTARGYGSYSIEDLIHLVHENESRSKWNLITNLESLRDSNVFDGTPTKIEELLQEGRVSIINLKGTQPEIQGLIVMSISTALFEARKRGELMPFLLLVEEAHNFCPERGTSKAISSAILRTVASEGRKFGMGLCVVSQRPARIDKNVLSQCNTQIILKITNPNDLRAISQSIEGFTNDLEDEIRLLLPGVALIVGEVVEQPIIVNIRVKRSQHGGGSVDMIREPQPKAFVAEPKVKSLIQRLFFR